MIRPAQVLSLVVAGVVLVSIGGWLVVRHGTDSTAQPSGPVLNLKQDQLNAVTRLRIFKGDGSHVTLSRDASRWVVAERGYAADTGQVRKLLLDLSALQVEEQKTSDPALYSKLGVEDPHGAQTLSTGVDIDLNAKTLSLIVGKTSGTGSVYVRIAGTAPSLLASPQLTPDADPRHWLDRSILDVPAEQVNEVAVKPASGPQYTVKRDAVTPIPKGRELADPGAPAAQAGALVGLQLDDVRKAAARSPAAAATFHTSDGLVLTLTGIEEGATRYLSVAATASTPAAQQRAVDLNARLGGWEFELPGYRYDTLFRPLEQLLKPLPAPKPAAAKAALSPAGPPTALPFGPQGSGPGKVTPQQSH
jgi:hypothetical protein